MAIPNTIDDQVYAFTPGDEGTFFITPGGLREFVRELDADLKIQGYSHGPRQHLIELCLEIIKAEVSR